MQKSADRHGLSDAFFEECKRKIGKSKRYLSGTPAEGVYDSEWKLIVPSNVLDLKNGGMTNAGLFFDFDRNKRLDLKKSSV